MFKNNVFLLFVVGFVLTGCVAHEGSGPSMNTSQASATGDVFKLQDSMDQINYSVGYQLGNDFQKQNIDMRSEALVRGIDDAMQGRMPLLSEGEMKLQLLELKKRIVDEDSARRSTASREGRAFLEKNAQQQGVVVRESGLQYRIDREGTGSSPGPHDWVRVHYRSIKLNGKVAGDTYKQGSPAEFPVDKVIPGWREALPLMREGSKWTLYLSPDLAFGEKGPLADQTMTFEVELLKVLGERPPAE